MQKQRDHKHNQINIFNVLFTITTVFMEYLRKCAIFTLDV